MNEKKIKSCKKFVVEYLESALELEKKLESESSDRAKKKLEKKISWKKGMVEEYIQDLNKLEYDFSGFMEELKPEQAEMLKELFPYGLGKEVIDDHEARNFRIRVYKKRIKKLKEVEAKYEPYDPTLPVKEKLKNRIYKAEVDIGWYMLIESKKDSQSYEPAWNYEEHFATTVEFTEEEREIIERCYEVGKEYDAYFDEKSTTDFNGIYRQKYLDFECKETIKDALTLSKIRPQQIRHLRQVQELGGLAFFVVRFKAYNETYLLDAKYILDAQSKTFKRSFFMENGVLIKPGFQPRLYLLEAVDEEYFNVEVQKVS